MIIVYLEVHEWYEMFSLEQEFKSRSDQYVNYPYNNFNTPSSRQVTRIKKLSTREIYCPYNTKFSGLACTEMYGHQLGELAPRSWE